jgi:SAM-dependent methyltransferase
MAAAETRMQDLQESAYGSGYDYRSDAPHLKHPKLYDWLCARLRAELRDLADAGLPLDVLEVGAGDGAMVEPLLAAGAAVTATEMSRPSVAALEQRFGLNSSFAAVFDADGSAEALGDRRFALVLYASVLHHIPDYLAAIDETIRRHLLPGGALVSFQEPLWYPSLPRGVRTADQAMYLSWRITRGNLARGVASRLRRARHDLREDEPSDMVEYHAVRDGVDQHAIEAQIRPVFAEVNVQPYWSAHAHLWQTVGDRVGIHNTFALWAHGYRGDNVSPL